MTTTAEQSPAQEKKEEERFPDKVTIRVWDKQTKKFIKPYENLPAKKIEDDKGARISVKAVAPASGQPTIGSEITEASGTVWVVDKVTRGTLLHVCEVKKKP